MSDGAAGGDDPVRTLFVSGLPSDVSRREIYLLFRGQAGYEDCTVNYGAPQPVAFVVFNDQANALAAKSVVEGLPFEPDGPIRMRVELAKSNSKPRQLEKGRSVHPAPFQPRHQEHYDYPPPMAPPQNLAPPPPDVASMYNASLASALYQAANQVNTTQPAPYMTLESEGRYQDAKGGGSAGCSTLFVASLGPSTTETELKELFQRCYGFKRLRMNNKGPTPVAFVEFEDVACSTQALQLLQGFQLPSCDRGGMKLEFAKNPMGTPSQHKIEGGGGGGRRPSESMQRGPPAYGVPPVAPPNPAYAFPSFAQPAPPGYDAYGLPASYAPPGLPTLPLPGAAGVMPGYDPAAFLSYAGQYGATPS
mmetsp:Transcript_23204/g.39850  ORF Transcript_23204/g.39850 Transcript_23204/m.39850 type:complete len:363 (+) Transcript_23204:48-1136(+)